ncbi:hypothetical protein [Flavobacterium sp.]|uniref:hypothetical protein n=1 Tax=Flavobacterium sp. TaxID=239 RepID=UPI00391C10A2
MKYYKVVDEIKGSVKIDTKQSNYSTTLINKLLHQKLIQIICDSSKKLNIPLDIYFTLNNNIAMGGNDYLTTFPIALNGFYNVSNLTASPNIVHFKIPEIDLRKFISDIDDNQIYFFAEGYYLWEYIYEQSRAANYSHLPAREDSFFLFENISDCEYYIKTHKGFGKICEVELLTTTALFRGDMNILDEIPNYLSYKQTLHSADRYWKGLSSAKPVYEILFQGSCILKEI